MRFYGTSIMHTNKLTDRWLDVFEVNLISTRLLIWMKEKNIIKLDVQVILSINSWMFDTCRRQNN
jgi:hypothetical protein